LTSAPNIRFRIDFAPTLNLGPGKIDLLEAINAHGSLTSAAASLGLSYRRAWLLLDSLNKTFDEPVTTSSAGGKSGGGSAVTAFGRLLIDRYRGLEKDIGGIAARTLSDILPHVRRRPLPKNAVRRTRLAQKIPQRSFKKPRSES
jgi:molybdate transport system regulatory protein